MRAQTPDWPSGLVSMVVNHLFNKFEPQDTMSLIDMNHLKQQIGLKTLESNPQTMFEQIAALENELKTPMSDSEKIAIAIKKFPAEYQPVLTAKMRKEGGMLMASHIENTAFQYWWLFKYTPKERIFQIVTASRLCTVLDSRPSTTNNPTSKQDPKFTDWSQSTLLWAPYSNSN